MPFKKPKRENDTGDSITGKNGKYRRKEPPSPSVADYYNTSSVVRHPTAVRRSDQPPLASRNARSISVPSLHAIETKARYSPPPSPPKARSRSVRLNTKKALSFKKLKKLFGSHVELDNGGGLWSDDHQTVGTYRPLTYARPRSIGGSSDCSSSSYTHSDFSRCNSLRDSSHSRISHGNDSVFGVRQASYDSADYVPNHHILTGSSDSNLRPFSIAYMPRSISSTSLKNNGVQPKDPRHFSIAAIPANSTSVDPPADSLQSRKQSPLRLMHKTQVMPDDMESVWEDSHSFTYVPNAPVVPSDPGYRQLAEELMSALPTRKNSTDFQDSRMISDPTLDPRRISNDSGVESSSTKPNRSLPSTPNAQSFSSVRNGGASTPELRLGTPRDFLSQESLHSLPPGWDMAYTPQGLRYYMDHKSQTTHWRLPNDTDDSLELPTGWEVVRSTRYGTYYVNHNNKTAIYQHPYHARPPPPYHHSLRFEEEEPKQARERKTPARSHSHRSTQTHRVLDPNASLPRRSKSFRDQEMQDGYPARVSHERQLSTMTYVPPSPYQIAEIPPWLREYIDAPFGCKKDTEIQWHRYSHEDLTGLDTMIKRLLKKGSEQIVKQYEYYRVAVQQEIDTRIRQRHRAAMQKTIQRQLAQEYRPPPLLLPAYQEPSLDGGRYGPFHEEPRARQLQPRLSDSDFLQELEETFV